MSDAIMICAPGVPALAGLAAALEALGEPVQYHTDLPPAASAIRAEAPRTIVAALAPAGAGQARRITDYALDAFMAASDDAIFDMLAMLRDLKAALDGKPCTLVLVGPSVGLTGAPGQTALATMAEGQRGLMKTIARQWGPQIRFAWVSVWPPLLFDGVDPATLPQQPELGEYTPPLGGRPGWDDIAHAVLGAAEMGKGTTGQTIMADGGEWMLP